MSISDFSEAMRNRAINSWFSEEKSNGIDIKRPSVLAYGTDPYRASEGISQKNSFLITKDTIRGMLTSLGRNTRETNKIFARFLEVSDGAGSKINKEVINIPTKAANGRIVNVEAIHFPRISFDAITSVVNNVLEAAPGSLSKDFEKGHVTGLVTNLLDYSRHSIDKEIREDTGDGLAKSQILAQLDNVIAYYRKLDFDSANLQPASTLEVYARSDKVMKSTGHTVYTVEFQPKAINQRSGQEVKRTFSDIRELFDPKARTDAEYRALVTKIRNNVKDPEFRKQLLTLRSSPNLLEMINKQIRDTLLGRAANQEYHIPLLKVASSKGTRLDTKQVSTAAKQKIAQLQKLKQKVTSAKYQPLNAIKGSYTLVGLQMLLDRNLQNVVSANMGDEGYPGGQRQILNYRTGRFAESVKVERLALSREGMITAFYTYMKNPYQTFEPGNIQGSPKSRSPRLLISKSIAEIAALKVANRMRAVLV